MTQSVRRLVDWFVCWHVCHNLRKATLPRSYRSTCLSFRSSKMSNNCYENIVILNCKFCTFSHDYSHQKSHQLSFQFGGVLLAFKWLRVEQLDEHSKNADYKFVAVRGNFKVSLFSRSNQVSGHIFLQDKLLLEKVQFATFFFIFSLMLGFLFKGSASNDFSLPIYLQLNINSFSVDSCDMSFVSHKTTYHSL